MVRVALAGLLASIGLLLGACSGSVVGGDGGEAGDDGGGSKPNTPSTPAASPAKQCESYANTWCTKSFDCYVKVGRLKQSAHQYNVDMCKELIIDRLPCSEIRSVSSSYKTCISDINAMACSKFDVAPEKLPLVPQPAACSEALSF